MAEGETVSPQPLGVGGLIADFVRSSVGAKVIMAVTGVGLWGFVIIHLIGNLQIYQGAEVINAYGPWLRELGHGAFIWIARAGLTLCFVLHIFFGIRLAARNRAARPVGYRMKRRLRTSPASISMAMSGILVLAFLLFHLSHTTWGLVLPQYFTEVRLKDGTMARDVFHMMSAGFQHPWLVVLYIAGQIVLLSHLYHGTASFWQSLGWHHPTWSPLASALGRSIAALIFIGNISMPIALFLRGAP